MAADHELAARIAKEVAEVYGEAVARLLAIVTRRLARGITEPGWAEAKLAERLTLREEAQRAIGQLAEQGPAAARVAVLEAARHGHTGAPVAAVGLGPHVNQRAVEALAAQAVLGREAADRLAEQLAAGHLQILRSTVDVYRDVIAEVAAPGVVTGADTRRQAAQRALDRFALRGVAGFVDRAGRQWEIESYAEMATRTAATRALIEGRTQRYRDDGRVLVIVSDSPEECPLCRPFEGRLLSLTGEHVGSTVGGFEVVDTLAGAQARGLHHPNCTHDLRPFIPGLTKRFETTANPEGYRLRQEQRRLERAVRAAKRREAVALDGTAKRAAAAKRRAAQARLRAFVDEHDRIRVRAREQIGRAR